MAARSARVVVALACALGCGSKSSAKDEPVKSPARPNSVEPSTRTPARTPPPEPEPVASNRPPPVDTHAPTEEPMPRYSCPLGGDAARDPDKLLDLANSKHRARKFGAAYACATIAVDLTPRSVEAHHVRAAALAGLKRYKSAQMAFTMALALDADDPETLAAAADFYLNVLPGKRRDTTMIGYTYARRGRGRASSRRRKDRNLRSRLALLEGQALNDLGRPREALELIDDALTLQPTLVQARHERGVALFNLCKFELAQVTFEQVLRMAPDDPYAHHYAGLVYERFERPRIAESHFAKARTLAPGEFTAPVAISEKDFRAEVDAAVAELDAATRKLLEGVKIETAALPQVSDLTATDPPFSPTILGLYRGLPKVGRGAAPADAGPARTIILFRKNLARAVKTRDELNRQIRRTLVHEIGHLRGMDEDELRRKGLD